MIAKTLFAITFGGSSKHRLAYAYIKLGAISILSGLTGLQLAAAVHAYSGLLPLPLMAAGTTFIVQILTMCACITAYGTISSYTKLFSILQTLPLSEHQLRTYSFMPLFVVALLLLPMIVIPLYAMSAHTFGPITLVSVCAVVGMGSGMGFIWGKPSRLPVWVWSCLAMAALLAEYTFLGRVYAGGDVHMRPVLAVILTALLLLALFLWHGHRNLKPQRTRQTVFGKNVPMPYILKKSLRNRSVLLSLGTSMGLAAAYAALVHRYGIEDPTATGITVCLLSSLVACDLRALARIYLPAEITNLRGTWFFTCSLALAALVLGSVALLPLLTILSDGLSPAWGLYVLGTGIGLLVGNLLTPRPHDVSSQCFATLACLLCVLLVTKQTFFANMQPFPQGLTYAGVGVACVIFAYVTELKRNHFIWRNYAR